MTDVTAASSKQISSLGRHSVAGIALTIGLFGGLAYWASTVQIAGAVMAPGSIVVQSYPKRIQHLEGGVVKAVHVQDGNVVTAGQLLVSLDETAIGASLAALTAQWRSALIMEARLAAEIEGDGAFALPAELEADALLPDVVELMSTESRLFLARRTSRQGLAAQLSEQVTQLRSQIEGLETQQGAVQSQLEILEGELETAISLQQDKLMEISRVTALRRQQAELQGQAGQIVAALAGTRAAISERELQIVQLDDDHLTSALAELQNTRRTLADLSEQIRATTDRLSHVEIRAPQSGVVHESLVHTVGGVVAPGAVLMSIVPHEDQLVVGIHLSPMDIEKIAPGQQARIRFSSLDSRTTPEIVATVESVSPDVTQNPSNGLTYYTARLQFAPGETEKLGGTAVLLPGMPVEAFVQTAERTVLAYLIQPISDQLTRAMRED